MEPRRGSIRPLSAPAWAFQTLENENGLECGRREAAGDELSGEARRQRLQAELVRRLATQGERGLGVGGAQQPPAAALAHAQAVQRGHLRSFGGKSDRKSTRLNSSH